MIFRIGSKYWMLIKFIDKSGLQVTPIITYIRGVPNFSRSALIANAISCRQIKWVYPNKLANAKVIKIFWVYIGVWWTMEGRLYEGYRSSESVDVIDIHKAYISLWNSGFLNSVYMQMATHNERFRQCMRITGGSYEDFVSVDFHGINSHSSSALISMLKIEEWIRTAQQST